MELPFTLLGEVTTGEITIDGKNYGDIHGIADLYDNALGNILNQ
jgi:hypothetical protein